MLGNQLKAPFTQPLTINIRTVWSLAAVANATLTPIAPYFVLTDLLNFVTIVQSFKTFVNVGAESIHIFVTALASASPGTRLVDALDRVGAAGIYRGRAFCTKK